MRNKRTSARRREFKRRLLLENLESRRLLAATDLASISGLVFNDYSGNGYGAGEEIAGAAVSLYRDSGDGIFQSAVDTSVGSTATGADGRYEFSRLTAGNYFVVQPAQTVGSRVLPEKVSSLISVSTGAVEGQIVTTIDDFDVTQQAVQDTTNDGVPVTSAELAPEAIGGERDLYVNLTSSNGYVALNVDDPLLPNLLIFDAGLTGDGVRRISWDGVDGDALSLNDSGLGGVDLTDSGQALGLQLQIGADQSGGTAVVRLYSDDGVAGTSSRFSTATLPIPQTGGAVPLQAEFLPFNQFTATSGGGVDLTSVGAIELEIVGGANYDGSAEIVGTAGETNFTQDFANFQSSDLRLAQTVSDSSPDLGQSVTFTITIHNDGPDTATNVAVLDQLPAGVTLQTFNASQGAFNSTTGIWSVGTLASGGNAVLSLVTRVDNAGVRSNFAEVVASDQFDPDSTPDTNGTQPNDASEDDQVLTTITSQSIDLSIVKTAIPQAVTVGQPVTFTSVVSNFGASTATGIQIRDALPSGISYLSSSASVGTFNSSTSIWSLNTLAPGASATLTVIGLVNVYGPLTSTVEVIAADQTDLDSTPNNANSTEDDQASVTVESPQVDLSLTLSANPSTAAVGQPVTFTVAVSNSGPSDASGIQVSVPLPAGFAISSAQTATGTYNSVTGIWTLGNLLSGGNSQLVLVASPSLPGAFTMNAEIVAADQPDADSQPGNQNTGEDDYKSVAISVPQIDLSLTKTGTPATVVVGQSVTFTVTVTNDGPDLATGVQVLDVLPAGMSLVNVSTTQGTYDSQTGLWSLGAVPIGTNPSMTVVATVDQPGVLSNTAEIQAADQPDADSTPGNQSSGEDDQATFVVSAPQIDLSLSKTVDNTSPLIGDPIQFTIGLSNAGPSNATSVQVRDLLPVGLQYLSSTPEVGTYNSATGIWNVGSLASGANVTLLISASPTGTGIITNTAEVINADQPDADSTPDNNQSGEDDQASVMVGTRQIDLELSQVVDVSKPNLGDQVQFDLTITNAGPDDATTVSVRDRLPNGLNFVSATTTVGSYDSVVGVWSVGSLAEGASETLSIIATVTSVAPVTNVAEIISSEPIDVDSTPNNGNDQEDDYASVTITPTIADLSLTQTANLTAPNVGQNVIYTLVVENAGPDAASNVVVRDLLPAGMDFVNATPSQGSYDAVSGRWTVGSVSPGVTPSLQIEVTVVAPGSKSNTAEIIAADQYDPNSQPGNGNAGEDDQASLVITPPVSDLSIQKQINVSRPRVGDNVQYTVTVSNAGPNDASGVSVLDLLPSSLSFSGASTASGAYDSNSGIWSIGEIGSGQSVVLTIDGTVISATGGTNTAEIYTADQYDPDSTPGNGVTSEDDQAAVQFSPATSDLSLVKTANRSEVNVGEQVTFEIVVTNAGPDVATGLSVLDSMPSGLGLVSATAVNGSFDSATGVWSIGELAVNASTSLTIVANAIDPGLSTNVAQVQSVDQLDPDSLPGNHQASEDDQSSVSVTAAQIDLQLSMVVDQPSPNVGDQVRFTLRVDNYGPSNATGVTVRDLLPSGLSYLETNSSQGSYNYASGLWNVGAVPNGGFATLELVAIVSEILDVENVASIVSADQPDADSIPNNDVASEDDQVSVFVATPVADLSLTKSASNDRPNVGQQVVYTVDVRNDGPDAATGIQVQDVLPAGLSFVSAIPSHGDYNLATGIWSVSSLDAVTNATLQITAIVQEPGRKINGAELIAVDQADPDSVPNNHLPGEDDQSRVTIDPPVIDLSLEKSASPLRPRVGGELNYTLLLRNDGPDVATGIVVQDVLPVSTEFDSATESVGAFDPITGRWSIPSLAAGSSATLLIRTTVLSPGQPENRAEVILVNQFDSDSVPSNDDGADGNGNDEDDQAQVTVVTASSDLELTKSIDDDRPGVGSNVTFTLQVTNTGPDDASDIVVRDQLPFGMTFLSSDASAGNFDPATGRWSIPSLAVGKQVSLELIASVDTFGERDNVAEIVSSSQFDPDSTPGNQVDAEDDQDRVTLVPELVDLALTKVVNDPTPNVGDIVEYTLELDNVGPSDATLVEVTDHVPDGLIVTGAESSQGVYDPLSGVWNVGSVVIGSRPTLTIMARVDTPYPVMNRAEITAVHQPDVDSIPGNGETAEDDYAEVSITPQQADLSLTKSVNISAPNQNEAILFTVVVHNDGPDDATNVQVRDLLPAGADFVSSNVTSGSYNPVTGVWAFEAVESGAAQSLQVVARVQSKVPFLNQAEVLRVDQYDPDSDVDNQAALEDDFASVLVTPKVIDLSISSYVDIEEPKIGQDFEMTFVVSNEGPDDATGVELELQLPDGITVESFTPSRGVFDGGIWQLGSLGEGETVILTITANAQIRGAKSVWLEVTSHDQADIDSDPNNQVATEDDQEELLVKVPLYSKRLFLSEQLTSRSEEVYGWRRFG